MIEKRSTVRLAAGKEDANVGKNNQLRGPGCRTSHARIPVSRFIFNVWGPGLTSGADWNMKVSEGFTKLGIEWQEFVSRRLKEDAGLLNQLAASRSPQQIWEVYAAFWQKAFEDYAQEYARVGKLVGDLTNGSAVTIERGRKNAAAQPPPVKKAA